MFAAGTSDCWIFSVYVRSHPGSHGHIHVLATPQPTREFLYKYLLKKTVFVLDRSGQREPLDRRPPQLRLWSRPSPRTSVLASPRTGDHLNDKTFYRLQVLQTSPDATSEKRHSDHEQRCCRSFPTIHANNHIRTLTHHSRDLQTCVSCLVSTDIPQGAHPASMRFAFRLHFAGSTFIPAALLHQFIAHLQWLTVPGWLPVPVFQNWSSSQTFNVFPLIKVKQQPMDQGLLRSSFQFFTLFLQSSPFLRSWQHDGGLQLFLAGCSSVKWTVKSVPSSAPACASLSNSFHLSSLASGTTIHKIISRHQTVPIYIITTPVLFASSACWISAAPHRI